MPNAVLEVNEQNFDEEVLKSDLPVVVDFWAEWCGPCRMLAPVTEELAQELQGKMKFAKVDVDTNEALARRYGIQSIPHLKIFVKGDEAGTIIGYMPKQKLQPLLEKFV